MDIRWDTGKDEFLFETDELKGLFVADCGGNQPSNNRHQVRGLIHKGSGVRISPEGGSMDHAGALSVFRAYAENSWLGELRATEPHITRHENGATLIWPPSFKHQAKISATFIIKAPNIIDLDIEVEGHTFYPAYELLISNYVAPGLQGGLFVKQNDFADNDECEKIAVTCNPVFYGMYPFFPRDEYAAHIMTDGRGQKGRWYWRVACGRLYAFPFGFATDGQVDVVMMGRPEDVSAVGVTYAAEGDRYDGVARHHALYLSLFGRDLHPGEGWRSRVRLVAGAYGNEKGRLVAAFEQFMDETSTVSPTFEVEP